MCHGDTTPSITVLNPNAPRGMMADFSPHHKCRNFQKLQDWSVENQLNYPPKISWEPRVKPNTTQEKAVPESH
jgi:hypothetical protein